MEKIVNEFVKCDFLYVLLLEEGKYYIGATTDLKKRLETHFNGEGSVWTIKYKPIAICKVDRVRYKGELEENLEVHKYMNKFGIENVRGGKYTTSKDLNYPAKLEIMEEIEHLKLIGEINK